MCVTLWCSVKGRCVSRLEPSAEGTICEWDNSTDTAGVAVPKKVREDNIPTIMKDYSIVLYYSIRRDLMQGDIRLSIV